MGCWRRVWSELPQALKRVAATLALQCAPRFAVPVDDGDTQAIPTPPIALSDPSLRQMITDMNRTIDAIVDSSGLPMSIVIIGVQNEVCAGSAQ
jgi:hypothetical protein